MFVCSNNAVYMLDIRYLHFSLKKGRKEKKTFIIVYSVQVHKNTYTDHLYKNNT